MSFTGRTQEFLNKDIPNNQFFQDLNIGDFQQKHRIANTYTQSAVEDVLKLSMIEMNHRLESKQEQWILEGATQISQVPDQPLEDGFAYLYEAAVFHWAKAEIIRMMPTVTNRKTSDVTSTDADNTEDWYRKRADQYVRQIKGLTGISCELL